MLDETARRRIIQITQEIIASRVLAGEVDPDDDEQLRAAAKDAAATAKAAYLAAMEYISG